MADRWHSVRWGRTAAAGACPQSGPLTLVTVRGGGAPLESPRAHTRPPPLAATYGKTTRHCMHRTRGLRRSWLGVRAAWVLAGKPLQMPGTLAWVHQHSAHHRCDVPTVQRYHICLPPDRPLPSSRAALCPVRFQDFDSQRAYAPRPPKPLLPLPGSLRRARPPT